MNVWDDLTHLFNPYHLYMLIMWNMEQMKIIEKFKSGCRDVKKLPVTRG